MSVRTPSMIPALALCAALMTQSCGGGSFNGAGGDTPGAGASGATGAAGTSGAGTGGVGGTGAAGAAGNGGVAGSPGGASGAGGTGGGVAGASGSGGSTAGSSGSGGANAGGSGGGTAGAGGAGGAGAAGAPTCDPGASFQADDANCGACGYACVHGRHCSAGRCTPAWQPLPKPSVAGFSFSRTRHAAAVVGSVYVAFGGYSQMVSTGSPAPASNAVAGYDLGADAWMGLTPMNAARCGHVAVSTGSSVLAFGGLTDCANGTTTGPGLEVYAPDGSGGTWTTVSATGEPGHRYNLAAAWTGTAMLVYGGSDNVTSALSTGGLFTPSSGTWADASCSLAGCARGGALAAFLDGAVVRVWEDGQPGLALDVGTKAWSSGAAPTAGKVAQRYADDGRRIYFIKGTNLVSVYDRKTSSWLADDISTTAPGLCSDAATAWSGSEVIAWSGDCGAGPVSAGGRYQPPAPL